MERQQAGARHHGGGQSPRREWTAERGGWQRVIFHSYSRDELSPYVDPNCSVAWGDSLTTRPQGQGKFPRDGKHV
eukprot:1185425-Prorocentrum_minimum.AAC.4